MRAGGSKQKGGAFERKICVALSLWVSNGKKKDLYWRAAMSGGRATIGKKRGEHLSRQAGDICAVSPEGHSLTDKYYLECKHHKNLRLDSFIFGTGLLTKFWKETCIQATRYGKEPMLIAKSNNMPIVVLTYFNPGLSIITQSIATVGECSIRLFDDVISHRYKPPLIIERIDALERVRL